MLVYNINYTLLQPLQFIMNIVYIMLGYHISYGTFSAHHMRCSFPSAILELIHSTGASYHLESSVK